MLHSLLPSRSMMFTVASGIVITVDWEGLAFESRTVKDSKFSVMSSERMTMGTDTLTALELKNVSSTI